MAKPSVRCQAYLKREAEAICVSSNVCKPQTLHPFCDQDKAF